jgi:hypothetical protein
MIRSLKSITVLTGVCLAFSFSVKAQEWGTIPSTTHIYNTNTGNVGIGTGSTVAATEKLRVKGGNILLDYWATGTGNLYFGGKTDASQNGLRLSCVSGSNGLIDVRTPNATTGLVFRIDNNFGGTERMRINANGNVGINISNPTEKLQINSGVFKISGINSYGGPMMLFAGSATSGYTGDWSIEYVPSSQGNAGLNFWKPFGSPNGGNNYLFLADNGNVGIRTNNPTANFTVNGNMLIGDPSVVNITTPGANYKLYVQTGILTEKVKVSVASSANWADYVFDEKYKLKSISDLELFIKTHKHLPNVPSADEVVKNGIDMATMDAKLLEKIEELSLYIIEQNKRIEALELKK